MIDKDYLESLGITEYYVCKSSVIEVKYLDDNNVIVDDIRGCVTRGFGFSCALSCDEKIKDIFIDREIIVLETFIIGHIFNIRYIEIPGILLDNKGNYGRCTTFKKLWIRFLKKENKYPFPEKPLTKWQKVKKFFHMSE